MFIKGNNDIDLMIELACLLMEIMTLKKDGQENIGYCYVNYDPES